MSMSMKDLYKCASMHQRARKHDQLKPMDKDRFIWIAGIRGKIAWEAAEKSRHEKTRRFYGWTNYFTHEAWIRKHHPDWPF